MHKKYREYDSMSEETKNTEIEQDSETLKTFDMYHFFSRKDVILAIILIVALLVFALYSIFYPQMV
ncbi:MAG: hypothetical protein CMH26_05915 [Micavibrio sp.]|nr:hypothetical protein [Micavibrio sp.]|tara:strand:- start:803 stop:1000 length:198 start_codon:yes stop_codon:yes gene_type:complete